MKTLKQTIQESMSISDAWKSICNTFKSIFNREKPKTLNVRVEECDIHRRWGGESIIHADLFNDPLKLTKEMNKYISSEFNGSIDKIYNNTNAIGDDSELVDVFNSTVYVFKKEASIDSIKKKIVEEFERLANLYCRYSKRYEDTIYEKCEIHTIQVNNDGWNLYPTISLMW